jgi:Mg2+ and Co2+ transporter CorA
MLEIKEDEEEKCARTIDNFLNTIKDSQKQIDELEKEERNLNEQKEFNIEHIGNVELELVQIHSMTLHLKKTREMKLSRESSSPIQTESL